jgi:hypothetical protein
MGTLVVTAMCGGKAVVDGEPGVGGDGGAGGVGGTGDGTGATGPGPAPGPGPVTTTGPGPGVCVDDTFMETRAPAGDCQAACEILFCCAERECPGVDPGDESAFVPDCVATCQQQMALVAVVNGAECATTVSTISSVSQDFQESCFEN